MPGMEESIYNLIPPTVEAGSRAPMYRSKFPRGVAPTASTFGTHGTSKPGVKNVGGQIEEYDGPHPAKKGHATFGKTNNRREPTDILRATKPTLPDPTQWERPLVVEPKPPLPSRDEFVKAERLIEEAEKPVEKNFVQANAVENILSQPKKAPEPIDWRKRPSYGKVPNYLKNIKKEIDEETSYMRAVGEAQAAAPPEGMRLMSDDEREGMVRELKQKWDKINEDYQKSSTLSLASLDTIGKVKRKEQYEAQLAQIEKDIEKLSKPVIWVHDDSR